MITVAHQHIINLTALTRHPQALELGMVGGLLICKLLIHLYTSELLNVFWARRGQAASSRDGKLAPIFQ